MKDELENLGYKKTMSSVYANNSIYPDYIEWEKKKEDVRISYMPSNETIYIRQISSRRPIAVSVKEVMALLLSIGKAEIAE